MMRETDIPKEIRFWLDFATLDTMPDCVLIIYVNGECRKYMKMGVIGSGFYIINIPPSFDIASKVQEEGNKKHEFIEKHRGDVISHCVGIGQLLDKAILEISLKVNSNDNEERVHKLSLSRKKEKLHSLVKKHPEEFKRFSAERQQAFFADLNYIIEMRNALAHGDLTWDYGADVVFLQNKNKEIVLDQNFFEVLNNKFSTLRSIFLNDGLLDPMSLLKWDYK